MVGAAGFEPTTPSPPDWCANQAAPRSVPVSLGLSGLRAGFPVREGRGLYAPAPASANGNWTLFLASRLLAVGACEHHHIAVGVAQPHLAMLRGRIDVGLLDDFGAQSARPRDGGIEIGDLEPKHHAVSHRRRSGVDEVGMILFIPGVELEHEAAGQLY